jgi:hypothetical protein
MKEVTRADFSAIPQETLKPLYAIGKYAGTTNIEEKLQLMVKVRASQINGCAWCLDMNWKDARALVLCCLTLFSLCADFILKAFSVRSPPTPCGFSSAEYFDKSACTALPESQDAFASLLHL